MHIILGSQSPRRKEIFSYFNLPFTVISGDFDEDSVEFKGCPKEFVQEVALGKAHALQEKHKEDLIITADTTVYYHGRIFQKPASYEEALQFLEELQGKTHQVCTAVVVCHKEKIFSEVATTDVTFHPVEKENLIHYLNAISPLDKAGGYGIQGPGCLIVSKIVGCYYNVLGLPVHALSHLLLKVGINLWAYLGRS